MTTALREAPEMADGADHTGERITREEAARRLGVALVTVDRYLRAELLSRHKNRVTGRVTLSAAEVERLRRERER